jgi:hypothetical protein
LILIPVLNIVYFRSNRLPLRFHVDQDTAGMLIRFGMDVSEHAVAVAEEEVDEEKEKKKRVQQSVDVMFFRRFSLSEVRAKIDYGKICFFSIFFYYL